MCFGSLVASMAAEYDIDWISEQYHEEGKTQTEIASELGITQPTLSGIMDRHGVKTRSNAEASRKWQESDDPYRDADWLREQYWEQGKTLDEMADGCDVSRPTIADWMDKHSIDRRDQSEAQAPEGKHTDEEWLRKKYVDEGRSMHDISKEAGVSPRIIKRWLDKFGIETRSANDHHKNGPATHFWDENGYEVVCSKHNYENDTAFVHQLVAIAKGANPAKVFSNGRYHVHHKNGVKWDTRPCNLELISSKTHVVRHHHDDKHLPPSEWAEDVHFDELLFELNSLVVDWRESDNSVLEMAADELDGNLSEL